LGQTTGDIVYERIHFQDFDDMSLDAARNIETQNPRSRVVRVHRNEGFFYSVKSTTRFFETEERFLSYAQKIPLSLLLCNQFELQISLPKRTNDSDLKLPKLNERTSDDRLGFQRSQTMVR
jgi:hypothetical protein